MPDTAPAAATGLPVKSKVRRVIGYLEDADPIGRDRLKMLYVAL